MEFGLAFTNTGPFAEPAGAAAFARAAEEAGFDSLWTVEHVVVPSNYQSAYPYDPSGKMPGGEDFDIPDPLIWLSYVAAATSRIKLATGILILPQRNPVVLAKELATLDKLSGGRMLLGIGSSGPQRRTLPPRAATISTRGRLFRPVHRAHRLLDRPSDDA